MAGLKRFYNKVLYKLSSFYGISKTEAMGFVILIPLIFILVTVPLWYRKLRLTDEVVRENDLQEFQAWSASIKAGIGDVYAVEPVTERSNQPFQFDPNTATKADLIKLDFPEWLSERIVKYRSSGGKFKTRSDLKRIYGMPEALIEDLWEYIDLPEYMPKDVEADKTNISSKESELEERPNPMRTVPILGINVADTLDFTRIRGIGAYSAKQIIKYRSELGGYVHKNQLNEVYGLWPEIADTVRKYFEVDEALVVKMGINTADAPQLARHPYISRKLASSIVEYRTQHGNFDDVFQLKEIKILSDSIFYKIRPYIIVD